MNRVAFVAAGVFAAGTVAFVLWPRADLSYGVKALENDATLYCSVDQDHSLAIVEAFQKTSGIRVDFKGETEAARSVGMTQKLFLERENPAADVFWGNEIMNTVYLRDVGIFAPLPKGVGDEFPAAWRDPKGTYVAFAARARILLVNTRLLPDPQDWPTSVDDLVDEKWGGAGRRAAIAAPLTGTTYTHAVVLLTRDAEAGKKFWTAVADRQKTGALKVVPGNGAVMQQVKDEANGVAFGLTDTDDARAAIDEKAPVAIVYPDQGAGRPGTVVIPNTVAIVKGAPHAGAGERLLRFLASKENEKNLAAGPSAQIPLRDEVQAPEYVKRPGKDFRAADVDWQRVGADKERWLGFLQSLFQR